jgi:hypothetical protein
MSSAPGLRLGGETLDWLTTVDDPASAGTRHEVVETRERSPCERTVANQKAPAEFRRRRQLALTQKAGWPV